MVLSGYFELKCSKHYNANFLQYLDDWEDDDTERAHLVKKQMQALLDG